MNTTRPYLNITRVTVTKITLCAAVLGWSALAATGRADTAFAAKKKMENAAPKIAPKIAPAPKPDTKPAGGKDTQDAAKAKEDKTTADKPKDTAETPIPDDEADPNDTTYNLVEKDPTGDHYTSIIIDASDYHVTTSMSPKICRADGTKVWPNLSFIDPDYVISYGIVIYAHSLDEAKALKRAGKNPLVIRASGHGKSPDDPVLTDADAESVLTANKRNLCMDKFKVIFILDKKKPDAMPAQTASAAKPDTAKNTENGSDKKG